MAFAPHASSLINWCFLEFLVANNRRKIEAYLEQILEAFTVRHEWEITRIPKNVRKLTLKQFMAYGGTVQTCAQALAKQRVEENEESGLARKRYMHISSELFWC